MKGCIVPKGDYNSPMISEIDIYRSAMVFVKKYGDRAREEAALQAIGQVNQLNKEGLSVWCRIVDAINKIQSTDGTCIH